MKPGLRPLSPRAICRELVRGAGRAGLTRAELTSESGLGKATVSRIWAIAGGGADRSISLRTFLGVCAALDVDPSELLRDAAAE